MATKQRLLRLTLMQYKNPKITDEEFQKHWSEHHAPIASAWLARNGIVGYTQVKPNLSFLELHAKVKTNVVPHTSRNTQPSHCPRRDSRSYCRPV